MSSLTSDKIEQYAISKVEKNLRNSLATEENFFFSLATEENERTHVTAHLKINEQTKTKMVISSKSRVLLPRISHLFHTNNFSVEFLSFCGPHNDVNKL